MTEDVYATYRLDNPLAITGKISEDKTIFYNLAISRIQYQTRQENRDWLQKYSSRGVQETTATYIIEVDLASSYESVSKYVSSIKIVVNKEIFDDIGKMIGEDCTDLIPFVVEHDVYEAWLSAKTGRGSSMTLEKKHLLARRREFYLAEQQGLGEKLYLFQRIVNPSSEEEVRVALEHAQKRLRFSS